MQPPDLTAILRPIQSQALTFNTHAFVKRLTQAGMPEDQAEVLASGQSDLYERLVTKEYFEFTLKHELEKLRAELKHDIETLRAELKHELDQHKAANKQALKELELTLKYELETTKTELKRDIKEMEEKLTIKLGAIVVIGITVLSVPDKLF